MLLPPAATLYPHRCTIYRQAALTATAGVPAAEALDTTTEEQECYFQTGESVLEPAPFAHLEQDNMFTLDLIRYPSGEAPLAGNILLQTTGPDEGAYWEVRGNEKKRSQFGQYETVRASRIPEPPAWVT